MISSNTQHEDDRRSAAVDAVAAVLHAGRLKFPEHPYMHVLQARYYEVYRPNAHRMATSLKAAYALKPVTDFSTVAASVAVYRCKCVGLMCGHMLVLLSADIMIFCYQCSLERRLKGDTGLRVSAYLQFQEHLQAASKEMAGAITAQAQFWSELMTDRPDMQQLMNLGMVRRACVQQKLSRCNVLDGCNCR